MVNMLTKNATREGGVFRYAFALLRFAYLSLP